MHQRRWDHYGPELREADLLHAERILKDHLRRRRWTEAELSIRRKGDPEKVQMASQLRAQTTMTLRWIEQRLKMGAWTHVSNCLVQERKNSEKSQSLRPLLTCAAILGGSAHEPALRPSSGTTRRKTLAAERLS